MLVLEQLKSISLPSSAKEAQLARYSCPCTLLSRFFPSLSFSTAQGRDVLNLTFRELLSGEFLGKRLVWTVVPLARTFGGRNVRKRRAGFAQVEKGLNLAVTSVMNFVIILFFDVPAGFS